MSLESIKTRMNKQILLNSYNRTKVSNAKEWATETCYNLDAPQNLRAE